MEETWFEGLKLTVISVLIRPFRKKKDIISDTLKMLMKLVRPDIH